MPDPTPLSIHEPEREPRGGVVVVQEAFGVNDHIEDICSRLADDGWVAVAPHLYHRTGDPKLGYDEFSRVGEHVGGLTLDTTMADVDAAIGAIAERGIPMARTGIVGFCMGGTVALAVATRRPVGAAVSFYGGGILEGRFGFDPLVEEAPRLQAPWLGLFGDLDKAIPVDQVEALREAAARSGRLTEVVRYPEAAHGFNCDRRDSYHEPSATDAWARTLAWFGRHLAGDDAV